MADAMATTPGPSGPRRAGGVRFGRIAAWLAGLLIGLPLALAVLVLVVVLIGANTGPGRRLIEQQAASLTGGLVRIDGLGGRFPDALTARRIAVSDTKGAWLTIDGLVLDWSPLALLGRTAHVERAEAQRILFSRLPVANPNAKPSPPAKPGQKSGLHLGIRIDSLRIARFDVAPAAAGVPPSPAPDGMLLSGSAEGHATIADLAPILDGAAIDRLPDTDLDLRLRRLDRPGAVSLATLVSPGRLALHAAVDDGPDGFVATLGHLPLLAPLHLKLDLDGPRRADALSLAATAGSPRTGVIDLAAHGVLDLVQPHFDVAVSLHAPAMQPLPGVSWNKIALDAHLLGTPASPGGQGTLLLDELSAAGAGVNTVNASFGGQQNSGPLTVHMIADGIRIPGPKPALLAGAPLVLDARYDAHAASRPVDLTVSHPLLNVSGRVNTLPSLFGKLAIALPDLAPLAAAGGAVLSGHARFDLGFALDGPKADATLSGPLAITGGQPQAVGLIGSGGHLSLDAGKNGTTLVLRSLALDGDALHLTASGTDTGNVLAARFSLGLPMLSRALPSLRGALAIDGTATGPTDDLAAHLEASGDPGTATMPTGKLHLVVDAAHLPRAPAGTIALDGTLDRAPLTVKAEANRLADGTLHLLLRALDWKSATGRADMSLPPGGKLPLGTLDIRMTRLADLAPVIGQPVSGALLANVRTSQAAGAPPRVTIAVKADGGTATARVARLALAGVVADPLGRPSVDATLDATGLQAAGVSGQAHVTARGPQDALDVTARAALIAAGAPAALDAALRLDLPKQRVAIGRLSASGKGEAVRLLAPATIAFGAEKSVDRLRLSLAPQAGGAAPATIDVRGQIMPRLDLDATVAGVTPALARPFAPTLDAVGTIGLQAHLTGSTAQPSGTVRLQASGMRLRTGPAASLPPASLNANVALAGRSAQVDVRLKAGPDVSLAVNGTAPLSATGPIALHANGRIDLRLANAVLGAQGRELDGVLQLALAAGGTAHDPLLSGTMSLSNGQFQDFGQGVRLTGIEALLRADGKSLSIDHLLAHAGGGTIAASGTVGALQPGLPVDLHLVASKARPLSSDLLTATLDADLRVHGQAAARLDVGGTVTVDAASINIPNGLPPSVARLDVIRPGETPQAAPASDGSSLIGLDVTLNAPGEIFVRGHGLDAELGGRLHVGGTSKAPQMSGGFSMRRGTFDLAGISLTFTKGMVGFNGTGVGHKIDPTLDFVAQSIVNGTVAQLNVGGYASQPRISLSSTPPLPQDQILALILFGQEMKSLSALQIAQIATALASLSGSGGGFDPLGTLRKSLGLDRLSVGSGGNSGSGASVEAGKYVARGVYVGAKQATSGGGTQAQVQIDLTRRLKLLTTVGTGGAVTGVITPENDPGSSVALKYQFQY